MSKLNEIFEPNEPNFLNEFFIQTNLFVFNLNAQIGLISTTMHIFYTMKLLGFNYRYVCSTLIAEMLGVKNQANHKLS